MVAVSEESRMGQRQNFIIVRGSSHPGWLQECPCAAQWLLHGSFRVLLHHTPCLPPQHKRSPSLGEGPASRSQSKALLCPVSYDVPLWKSLVKLGFSADTHSGSVTYGKRMTSSHLQPATRVKMLDHTQKTHREDGIANHCAECRRQTQHSHHTSAEVMS